MRKAIVRVEPISPELEINSGDFEVIGEYEIELDDEVTEVQIADVALDVFHSNITIKVLEYFNITVIYSGVIKEPNPEHESYTFDHLGSI